MRDFYEGARTSAIANDSATASDAQSEAFASAIERRLAELGFAASPMQAAHYRIAFSHETHPASVGIGYAGCSDGEPCGPAMLPPGFEWPGASAYIHSLTLRFFDRADGREAYKVSVTKRDRAPDAGHEVDDLVASALARLPFVDAGAATGDRAGKGDWKVTLSKPGADTVPRVTGIAPLVH